MKRSSATCLLGLVVGLGLGTQATVAKTYWGSPKVAVATPSGVACPTGQTPGVAIPTCGTDRIARREPEKVDTSYRQVVANTAAMVGNEMARKLTQEVGLDLVNLTWEDTGRYKGSCVGPNISDMTIQVQQRKPNGGYDLTCMPVIRFPNFSDRTADLTADQLSLLVGNEKGEPLHRVSLRDYLADVRRYLTDSESWAGSRHSLLADRDTHVLVSAQACFLPVPKEGKAQFNPVLFNYQSRKNDPAVLAILATRQGTSATIIDNQRDGFAAGTTWGQRLFFNDKGKRASLTGERLSDFKADTLRGKPASAQIAGEEGLNMVMLIQVPLKQKERPMRLQGSMEDCAAPPTLCAPTSKCAGSARSDVENAVISHGKAEGPFTEIDHQAIERDNRYPIRVTVQFYKATSNGVMSPADAQALARQIDRVYAKADYVGSLVVAGNTGRPTEHDGPKHQPARWWSQFWATHEAETGQSREEAMRMLNRLLGPNWEALPPEQIRETLDKARS